MEDYEKSEYAVHVGPTKLNKYTFRLRNRCISMTDPISIFLHVNDIVARGYDNGSTTQNKNQVVPKMIKNANINYIKVF